MVALGLLKKEWNQYRKIFLSVFFGLTFILPIVILLNYIFYQNNEYLQDTFQIRFEENNLHQINSIFVFLLAIYQLGQERSRGTIDFTLSLPYKRSVIYFTKWLMGAMTIVFSIVLNTVLTGVILSVTNADYEGFLGYFSFSIVSILMLYTLVFASGALTGTPFAQGLVAFSAAILPFLLIGLLLFHYGIFVDGNGFNINPNVLKFVILLTPMYYISYIVSEYPFLYYAIPILFTAIFYFIGYVSFIYHPTERNGSFFLWKELNRPVQMLVILLGILGFGSFIYLIFDQTMFGYGLGIIIGALVGYFISSMLLYKKKGGEQK
ncbi:hypothetical protein [Bacillus alveayuensis]|uniref:hypothetical protein n=1 Tax=Aeribacillus alveayuensis TaxID=279215 RepID=UPI0005CCEB48|nr:hypothetical protein [Bacillus alveayuensis]